MARSKNQLAKEKYERQKELTRERVRRYRERMSEEKKEEKKQYDRNRFARLKAENKIKGIVDLTPREQRRKRKYWRERNRARSLRKKSLAEVTDTPPDSPSGNAREELSVQKRRGRKQVRKDRAKSYRTVAKQKEQIKMLEKKLAKYKKRLQREKKKHTTLAASPSPRKEVSNILRGENVSPRVRKQLFLGFAIQKQIKSQAKEIGDKKREKQILRNVVGNKVLKKYRVKQHVYKLVGRGRASKTVEDGPSTSFEYKRQEKKCITKELADKLQAFFEDDRVSKMCPGKRDFVNKGGIKKQRRILLGTLSNLHEQFQRENNSKISKASFCRSRPFWVTFPKMADRETCACIKHSNMELLITALKHHNVIVKRTPREVLQHVVCSTDDESCMLSKCLLCKKKEIEFSYEEDFPMKYYKWKKVNEEKVIKGIKKQIKKTVKCKVVAKVSKLKAYIKKEMMLFKKHVYYVKHQTTELNNKIEQLMEGELLFRLDFSENYVAKYEKEVQSVHFGASKRQVSLNTGVWYAKEDGEKKVTCFASASDNLDHQAHAVWSHMEPVFKSAADLYPNTTTVHIFSDSPSSQYRNRINMHLLKTLLPKYFQKMASCTWNFTEAGHGKGPMDGVGGTLKREADKKVLRGTDICCAKDFVSALQHFNIDLYEIPAEVIVSHKNEVDKLTIPPINGIMKAHQITCSVGNIMYARSLSFFLCPPSECCTHYTLGEVFPSDVHLNANKKTNANQRRRPKLCVDEVFTSSEGEEHFEDHYEQPATTTRDMMQIYECTTNKEEFSGSVISGAYVLVEYQINKRKVSKSEQFIGVCQNDPSQGEVVVMFLKCSTKDNQLFVVNDKDIVSVPLNQIKAVFPHPIVVLKGNRVFYKFKKAKKC